jgi:hypothetical protein
MRNLLILVVLIAGAVLLNFDIPSIPPENESQCLDCHASLVQKKVVHPPAAKKCAICHESTGRQHPGDGKGFTLTNTFPSGMYTKAVTDTFALCWDCHDMEMMQTELSTSVTEFRNKDRNLHFVHVGQERSRSCTVCHNVHASDNPHLIVNNTLFGNWNMKMNYIAQDSGGTCSPGCHGVKEYKR